MKFKNLIQSVVNKLLAPAVEPAVSNMGKSGFLNKRSSNSKQGSFDESKGFFDKISDGDTEVIKKAGKSLSSADKYNEFAVNIDKLQQEQVKLKSRQSQKSK